MNILVLCDLEGAAGVVDFHTQTYDNTRYNDQAKNLSTLEINALVDGALEGGADQVIVLDGHGSGGINIELIHYEARVMFGRPLVSAWDLGIDFKAMFLYGHHAMENTPAGVLCHSWSSRDISNCWLNGELIGEIGFNIARAGEAGVPTAYISGDRAAIDEATEYVGNIEGVVVKEGLSRTAALTLSPAKARDLIREGCKACDGPHRRVRPVQRSGSLHLCHGVSGRVQRRVKGLPPRRRAGRYPHRQNNRRYARRNRGKKINVRLAAR